MASTSYKDQLNQLEQEQRIMMQRLDRFTRLKQELLIDDIKFIQQARLLKKTFDEQKLLIDSIKNSRGNKGLTGNMVKKERLLVTLMSSVGTELNQLIEDADRLAKDLN